MFFAKGQGSVVLHFRAVSYISNLCFSRLSKAGANVRVRVGGRVIRVEVGEAVIGPVVRITANLEATSLRQPILLFKKVMVPSFLPESYLPGELAHLSQLLQDVDDIRGSREHLAGLRFRVLKVVLEFE